jgi:hypothetical protein
LTSVGAASSDKAKGKRQRAKVQQKSKVVSASLLPFYFCPLPSPVCLFTFAFLLFMRLA